MTRPMHARELCPYMSTAPLPAVSGSAPPITGVEWPTFEYSVAPILYGVVASKRFDTWQICLSDTLDPIRIKNGA